MMRMTDCYPTDEVFTHVDEYGRARHINASAMFRDAGEAIMNKVAQFLRVELEEDFVRFILEKRGVERYKIDRLKEPYLSYPLIGVWWGDGSCLTVDGHHRIVRFHEMGRDSYEIVIYNHDQLEKYCIEDIPDMLEKHMVEDAIKQVPTYSV